VDVDAVDCAGVRYAEGSLLQRPLQQTAGEKVRHTLALEQKPTSTVEDREESSRHTLDSLNQTEQGMCAMERVW